MRRGEIWSAQLEDPTGSGPGFRRPVVIVSSNAFNETQIDTVVVVVMTGNVARAGSPGNVLVPGKRSDLPRDSVINVTQLMTIDKRELDQPVGRLPARYVDKLNAGLRLVLGLG